ncbi:hypothetical protein BLX24_21610 [Arsenicibacter rosenii]|uniref:Uncharacterized protein n=2 Tax=Arsenicibacter rosenii TaxID=1750698 RepID=A0A1S2VFF6_9BACT|nr:hypothetical protein BLX24_21610 [Arsenicibacter rosenii]
MTYQTKIDKGYDGWQAKSEAVLGQTPKGTRLLSLRTSKTRQGLASTASVFIRSLKTGYAVDTTILFQDFFKSGIAPTACNRVTGKSLETANQAALSQMESLLAEAQAFYNTTMQA